MDRREGVAHLAGGIAAALYKKATTGKGSVVDVSLLGLAAWNLSPDVAVSQIHGGSAIPKFGHADAPNPLVGTYRTKDNRFVQLMMLQLDKFYNEAMNVIGLPDLVVAATTDIVGGQLATSNVRHFPMFPDLKAPY